MRVKLFAVTVVTVLLPSAVAEAGTWPRAVLTTPNDAEEGSFASATWATRTSWECVIKVVDGEYGFPSPPVQWVPGTEIAVRFEKRERPRRVDVRAFLLGDPFAGVPLYGEMEIAYELRRVEVDGVTMWEAVLSPPPWPDLYLEVTAEWKRVPRCGARRATWKWRAGLLPI